MYNYSEYFSSTDKKENSDSDKNGITLSFNQDQLVEHEEEQAV